MLALGGQAIGGVQGVQSTILVNIKLSTQNSFDEQPSKILVKPKALREFPIFFMSYELYLFISFLRTQIQNGQTKIGQAKNLIKHHRPI